MKKEKINETFGALLMVLIALGFVIFACGALPATMDGMSYIDAIKDAFGLRVAKLAVFDVHCVAALYFYGGRSFNISETFKVHPGATAAILSASFIGSALMIM